MRAFREKFPAIQLILREGVTDDQLSDVEAGVLDVALVRGPIARASLRIDTLRREAVVLAVPTDHPLSSRAAIAWADLADYGFVMFPRSAAPPLYDAIIAQCARAQFVPRVVHEATDWSTVSALIAAGEGIGFATESASRFHVAGVARVCRTRGAELRG